MLFGIWYQFCTCIFFIIFATLFVFVCLFSLFMFLLPFFWRPGNGEAQGGDWETAVNEAGENSRDGGVRSGNVHCHGSKLCGHFPGPSSHLQWHLTLWLRPSWNALFSRLPGLSLPCSPSSCSPCWGFSRLSL